MVAISQEKECVGGGLLTGQVTAVISTQGISTVLMMSLQGC